MQMTVSNVESETESQTTIRRMPTDNVLSSTTSSNMAPPMMKTATNHVIAPLVSEPKKVDSLDLPLQTQKTVETSFVTDFSMKNYSQMNGSNGVPAQSSSSQMTEKE